MCIKQAGILRKNLQKWKRNYSLDNISIVNLKKTKTNNSMKTVKSESDNQQFSPPRQRPQSDSLCCPVCGAELIQEKCKVVCRSAKCVYRIIYNCSEF